MRLEHWLYTIPMQLHSLFRRRQVDQELEEELGDHVEQKTAEYVAKAMTAQQARRKALLENGRSGTNQGIKHAVQDAWRRFIQPARLNGVEKHSLRYLLQCSCGVIFQHQEPSRARWRFTTRPTSTHFLSQRYQSTLTRFSARQ